MNRVRNWLAGLLALQLVLAAGLYVGTNTGQSGYDAGPLLVIDQAQIDKVAIASEEGEVTLLKQGDSWTLPELNNLPVDRDKLAEALTKIAALETGWPVATTDSSQQRFEVAEENYQRRIRLYQDGKLAGDLYLGSSPGFRKVHGRTATSSEVYALRLNAYDFPAEANDWLDKTLLAAPNIKEIRGADFVLAKENDAWTLAGQHSATATTLDTDKAEQLSRALDSLRVTGVAGEPPDFSANEVISLDVAGKEDWRYQFQERDNQYFVRRVGEGGSEAPVFTLSQYDYNRIAGVGRGDLMLAETDEETERSSAESAASHDTAGTEES